MATTPEAARAGREVSGAQVALIVLGLVALLGVLWFAFLRGDAEPAVEPLPAPAAAPTEDADEEEDVTRPRRRPVETFEVFAPKDPFKPLVSQAVGTGGTTTAGAPAGPTDNGTGTTGQPSGGSDISGGSNQGDTVGGHRVRLVDTFRQGGEQRARIQVDGTVYTVAKGDRFAGNFELLSISRSCVSLLYGDDQFSLCEGEEILK